MKTILLVEDDADARPTLKRALESQGYAVLAAADGLQAVEFLKSQEIDLLLCDLVLPGGVDGMRVFETCRRIQPDAMAIFMTAHGTVELAVKAMKEGAYDFLEKPLNLDRLRTLAARAIEKKDLVAENLRLKSALSEQYGFANMIGSSPVMRELFRMVRQVAPTSAAILILGESGTGKELIANAIHYNSSRSENPFVKVNCGALPETLLESELFGHMRGAFTGAVADRKGRFELADGGTLFLDEIGDVAPPIQMKLLRVLQEGEFERVGGTRTIKADVRVITATNADLEKAVKEGRLREDFYYRIKGVTLRIPPLRDRREDIPLLAEHFVAKACREAKRPAMKIDPAALDFLKRYPWPGNVRQMENGLRTAVVLAPPAQKILTAELLPADLRPAALDADLVTVPVGISLAALERTMIIRTLEREEGNKTKAARALGIGVRTLYRKMDEYEIQEGKGS